MSRHTTASEASPLARSASEPRSTFSLSLRRYSDFQQVVDFRLPGVAVLGVDERPPLGHGWGPSPAHVLGSALGACLGSALLLVMQGAGVEVLDLRTDVSGAIQRDTLGQPHVTSISVRLTPVVASRSRSRRRPFARASRAAQHGRRFVEIGSGALDRHHARGPRRGEARAVRPLPRRRAAGRVGRRSRSTSSSPGRRCRTGGPGARTSDIRALSPAQSVE